MLEKLEKYRQEGLVSAQRHPRLPLTIWNYTPKVQYEGLWDEVTRAARGLVTDRSGLVARPFAKFFNLEEGRHRPTESFEAFEKLDGSLGILFSYEGEWVLATRGSFTSAQAERGREMLAAMMREQGDGRLCRRSTYMLEIIYPENRVVVDYGGSEKLVLLGVNRQGGEAAHSELRGLWFERGEIARKVQAPADASELKRMIGDNEEGFVVKFSNGDRAKVKGEEYLRLHRIMTCASTVSVWEALSGGEGLEAALAQVPDEFYSRIREFERELNAAHDERIDRAKGALAAIHLHGFYCDLPDRKEFAEVANRMPPQTQALVFCLRDGKDASRAAWKMVRPEFRKL